MKKKFLSVALATTMVMSSVMTANAETATSLTTTDMSKNTGTETLTGDFDITYTFHEVGSTFANGFLVELRDTNNNCIDARCDNWGWIWTPSGGTVDFTDDQKKITAWPSDSLWADIDTTDTEKYPQGYSGWTYIAEQRQIGVDVVANVKREGDMFYFEFTESNDTVGTIVTWTYTIEFSMTDTLTSLITSGGDQEIQLTNILFKDNTPKVYVQYKQTGDTYTVRVVTEVTLNGTFTDNINTSYTGAGFRCSQSEKTVATADAYASKVVFKSIVADGQTVTASADDKYFVVTEITDVKSDSSIYVTPVYTTANADATAFINKVYTINMANIIK